MMRRACWISPLVWLSLKVSFSIAFGGFSGICLQSTGLDGVDGSVVPIAIQARDPALRVVADDIGVSDAINFAFLHNARDVRGHGPTEQRLHSDAVLFAQDHLDDFDAEI